MYTVFARRRGCGLVGLDLHGSISFVRSGLAFADFRYKVTCLGPSGPGVLAPHVGTDAGGCQFGGNLLCKRLGGSAESVEVRSFGNYRAVLAGGHVVGADVALAC